jgi:hypothetical protein
MSSVNVSVDRDQISSVVREILNAEKPVCKSAVSLTCGDARKRIVVLDRNWNLIGMVRHVGDEIIIEDASVIRLWGTTRGLGEIAKYGPTPKTVLDPCGTVRAFTTSVVLQIDCEV